MYRLLGAGALLVLLCCSGCDTASSGKEMKEQTLTNEEFKKLDCAGSGPAPEGMETQGDVAVATTNAVAATDGTNTVAVVPATKAPLIGPGAQLTIFVTEDPSLNRQYIVPPSGVIDFPPLGRLTVSGLTAEELGQQIKTGLEKDYFQQATVEVQMERQQGRGAGPGVIYVLGRVGRAGPIALPPDEVFTLTKTILASGGGDTFANLTKVQIIRYCQDGKKYKTFVNVQRIMDNGEFEKDIPLQNGDWIIVPEKIINLW